MSIRGLLVALLCGLVGLGGGALAAYVVEPTVRSSGAAATPVSAQSPSIPVDPPTKRPYAEDIPYPALETELALNMVHQIKNRLATWTYHVPQGWIPVTVEPPSNQPIPRGRIDRAKDIRWRPEGEPSIGGYSLHATILKNGTGFNIGQMIGSKVIGFQQLNYPDTQIVKQTPSSVYFTYRDPSTNYHRFNYFQWYAVPGTTTATLQVSVAGRKVDARGLRVLLNRFADNLTGEGPAT